MSGARYFSETSPARGGRWIRQFHRWTSLVFTLCVIATSIALATKDPSLAWMSYLPLAPLFLLMITGLYLFASGFAFFSRERR